MGNPTKTTNTKRMFAKSVLAMAFALVLGLPSAFAQNVTNVLSGKVSDQNGEPLVGVFVQVKDSGNSTMTDVDGNYNLKKVVPNSTIIFSCMGMVTYEANAGTSAILNVTLQPDDLALEETVIIGYQTQKKVDLTGSVSSISANEIMKAQPFSTEQALKGHFAGVQITNSDGAPGSGVNIKIRGASSITAGTAPLYVVDGFPYPISDDPLMSPLSSISPDAIESITILKDVSSTAIYGAQGANGVVLITTKKGTSGHSEVAFKASFGIGKPSKTLDVLGPEEYLRSYMKGQSWNFHYDNTDFYDEFYNQIWETDPDRYQYYSDICFQNATKQNYEVSYRGGNNRVQNATTISYGDEKGLAINTGYTKFYLKSYTSFKVLKNLTFNTNLSYEHNKRTGAYWTESGLFNKISTFSPLIPKEWTFQDIDDNLYYTGKMDNPYRILNDIDYTQNYGSFYGQGDLVWNITKDLYLKGAVGVRTPNTDTKYFVPETIQEGYNNGGKASYSTGKTTNIHALVQAGYDHEFTGGHKMGLNAVFESNSYTNDTFSQTYTHFNTDLGWYGIYAAESGTHVTAPSVGYEKVTMLSGVVMGNYSYKDRYLVKASFRADASSKFAPANKWGFFPSGAIGWKISEEPFFDSSAWLARNVDNLKLRVSAGMVGNDQINSYQYINTLESGSRSAVFGDTTIPTLYLNRLVNDNISWEVTKEINVGLDIDMFRGRLSFTGDIYTKKTEDMLLDQHVPLISGFSTVTRNVGSVGNKGLELALTGRIIETKDITWTTSVNFATNQSKVLDLGEDTMMLESRSVGSGAGTQNVLLQTGLPLGLVYGLQYEGIRSNWNLDNNYVNSDCTNWWYASQRELVYGFPSWADINGDSKIDLDDRTVIGCVNPKFIGGFNTSFRWRWIEFMADFSFSYGNDIVNGNFYSLISRSDDISNKLSWHYAKEWYGNNTDGTMAGPGGWSWSGYHNAYTNSEIIEDGSYLKCNNLGICFHLPQKFVSKAKIRDLSLTYNITNLFCATKYSGYDPEVSTGTSSQNRILSGVDYAAYPYARTHTFTLNFKF